MRLFLFDTWTWGIAVDPRFTSSWNWPRSTCWVRTRGPNVQELNRLDSFLPCSRAISWTAKQFDRVYILEIYPSFDFVKKTPIEPFVGHRNEDLLTILSNSEQYFIPFSWYARRPLKGTLKCESSDKTLDDGTPKTKSGTSPPKKRPLGSRWLASCTINAHSRLFPSTQLS